MMRQVRNRKRIDVATPRARGTTREGGNTRGQKRNHLAKIQTQWELSCLFGPQKKWLAFTGWNQGGATARYST